MNHHTTLAIAVVAALLPILPHAQTQIPADRAMVAIVGDAELFNIGQDGYCGQRTVIDSPSKTPFLIPAGQKTWFLLSSKFYAPAFTRTCSGDFSFVPAAGKLHILRYSFVGENCLLEHFSGDPGKTPEPAAVQSEKSRSCLPQ
jgi:hypothetical protein